MIKKVYEATKQNIEAYYIPLLLWGVSVIIGCIIIMYLFIKKIRELNKKSKRK